MSNTRLHPRVQQFPNTLGCLSPHINEMSNTNMKISNHIKNKFKKTLLCSMVFSKFVTHISSLMVAKGLPL